MFLASSSCLGGPLRDRHLSPHCARQRTLALTWNCCQIVSLSAAVSVPEPLGNLNGPIWASPARASPPRAAIAAGRPRERARERSRERAHGRATCVRASHARRDEQKGEPVSTVAFEPGSSCRTYRELICIWKVLVHTWLRLHKYGYNIII